MANYEIMWNSLKRELQQLEEHYSDMRLYYVRKGQPALASHFKERGDGVAEAIMYMDLAEDEMSGNIIFENADCNACTHRETCKYKEAEVRGAAQLKLERFAHNISAPFIVTVSCRYFK